MAPTMDPEQYEHHVAAVLRTEGWQTTVSRVSRDLGIDVLATREDRRLAVQVKKYGDSTTKVNAERIMCLHGAAAYADCPERMLATDGELTSEAELVAAKLNVVIRRIPAAVAPTEATANTGFGTLWRDQVEPLAGTDLERSNGKTMKILEVDGSGVLRLTTSGTRQRIELDIFRWTVERLLAGDTVTRAEIHERSSPRRVSSGVLLILSQVPGFELVTAGRSKALRLRTATPTLA